MSGGGQQWTFQGNVWHHPFRPSTDCNVCHGTGKVRSPNFLVQDLELGYVYSGMVCATIAGSPSIFEVCREAQTIALGLGCPVAFEFNDVRVIVRPASDPDQVAREWWQEALGETPEESWARR